MKELELDDYDFIERQATKLYFHQNPVARDLKYFLAKCAFEYGQIYGKVEDAMSEGNK